MMRRLLLGALCLVFSGMLAAQTQPTPDHLAHLQALIEKTGFPTIVAEQMQQRLDQSPDILSALRMQVLRTRFQDKDFAERLTRITSEALAPQVSDDAAVRLSAALDVEGVRKLLQASMRQIRPLPSLTPQDQKKLQALDYYAILTDMTQLAEAVSAPDTRVKVMAFSYSECIPLFAATDSQLSAWRSDQGNAQSATMQALAAERSMLFDYYTESLSRSHQVYTTYNTQIRQLYLTGILSPATLVSDGLIKAYLNKVDQALAVLDEYKQNSHAVTQEAITRLHALPLSRSSLQFMQGDWEKQLEQDYTQVLSFQENQQKILYLYRRILQLSQDNLGKITQKDKTLVFDSEDTMGVYNALIQHVRNAIAEEKTLKDPAEALLPAFNPYPEAPKPAPPKSS